MLQALITAQYDVSRGGGQHVLVVRERASGDEPKTRAIGITALMLAPDKAPQVRPGDLLIIRDGPPTTQPIPPVGGVYYLGGQVERPGVYAITTPITLLDALTGAGLDLTTDAAKQKYVTVFRRDIDGDNLGRTTTVGELLKSPQLLEHVRAEDKIQVNDKPPATQRAR